MMSAHPPEEGRITKQPVIFAIARVSAATLKTRASGFTDQLICLAVSAGRASIWPKLPQAAACFAG
jgi:hypothetical protein